MRFRVSSPKAGISTLFLVSALAAFVAVAPARADSSSPPPRLLTVSGQGVAKAVPDSAQLSAGVVTQAPKAADALAANSQAMNAVFAALKNAGIPDRAIQTSNFSITQQTTRYRTGTGPERIVVTGYEVSNNVEVTVDDLTKLGPTIDALVAAGANQLGGINFSIRDPKPLLRDARAAAVKDAVDRAQTYARAAGISLGAIMSIQESGGETPRPLYRMAAMAAAPTPIAAGEESVTASVSISWEIR